MIRGLFRLLFQIVILAILVLIGFAAWSIYDGLSDKGATKADCALVLGQPMKKDGKPGPLLTERLDRAISLYVDKEVPLIIVSGAKHSDGQDESIGMGDYLLEHAIPSSGIIEDHGGSDVSTSAKNVAAFMKAGRLRSVVVVAPYYSIERIKLALQHEGVTEISQVHLGTLRKEDAEDIGREMVSTYCDLYNYYLRASVEKATIQAEAAAAEMQKKISSAAEDARDKSPDKSSGNSPNSGK